LHLADSYFQRVWGTNRRLPTPKKPVVKKSQ
jgi:hypothetical protein